MGTSHREKPTDRISEGHFPFSNRVDSFEEAYPTVSSLSVEVTESEVGSAETLRIWRFTERDFRHAVDCSNSLCYGGGVAIGWIIDDMARNTQGDREETKLCQGYEGSPKGSIRYRRCLHSFHIKAHLRYKNGEEGKQ